MPVQYDITHATCHRYSSPVTFGEHRVMFRPRDRRLNMNQFHRDRFGHARREQEGMRTPLQTLALGTGRCRAFALLMMEAIRRLGAAARFVSGYLHGQVLGRGSDAGTVGAGARLAWLQAYLPGAGWLTLDPTNKLLGGSQLMRVGVARDPSQASPVSGNWFGAANPCLGTTAAVQVRRVTLGG